MTTKKLSASSPASQHSQTRPDEAVLGLVTALRNTMSTIADQPDKIKLFPFGINKVSLSFTLPGGITASLDVEGPASPKGWAKTAGADNAFAFAGKSIDSLDLAPHAKAGARSLSDQFGADIIFTSGRRSVPDQCRAMAQNVVKTGDRQWIRKTYKNGQELQAWVDAHPDALSVDDLEAGLESVMSGWDEAKQNKISYHLSGAAFDLVPVEGARGDEIKAAIDKLAYKNRLIDGEAGVQVWHVQFDE